MSVKKLYEVVILEDDYNNCFTAVLTDHVNVIQHVINNADAAHQCVKDAAIELIEMAVDNRINEIISDYQMLVEEATLGEDL